MLLKSTPEDDIADRLKLWRKSVMEMTQEQFAEALGISVHTLRNWEQDRVKPDGPGLALLRIAARHPRIVRENIGSAA